ncbi:MAG: hypothetical protein KGS48_07620 [Bacteroidetes bacterium]|nr:hypothetical protein [Bacteroidota bacterium]
MHTTSSKNPGFFILIALPLIFLGFSLKAQVVPIYDYEKKEFKRFTLLAGFSAGGSVKNTITDQFVLATASYNLDPYNQVGLVFGSYFPSVVINTVQTKSNSYDIGGRYNYILHGWTSGYRSNVYVGAEIRKSIHFQQELHLSNANGVFTNVSAHNLRIQLHLGMHWQFDHLVMQIAVPMGILFTNRYDSYPTSFDRRPNSKGYFILHFNFLAGYTF